MSEVQEPGEAAAVVQLKRESVLSVDMRMEYRRSARVRVSLCAT